MKPQEVTTTLDVRGMLCPMPVLKTQRTMKDLPGGAVLEVLATDKGSRTDIPAWCSAQKHTLLFSDENGSTFRYYIQKGS